MNKHKCNFDLVSYVPTIAILWPERKTIDTYGIKVFSLFFLPGTTDSCKFSRTRSLGRDGYENVTWSKLISPRNSLYRINRNNL